MIGLYPIRGSLFDTVDEHPNLVRLLHSAIDHIEGANVVEHLDHLVAVDVLAMNTFVVKMVIENCFGANFDCGGLRTEEK